MKVKVDKHQAIQVIRPMDKHGWIDLVFDGHWLQAKVSSAPSRNGIDGGKVFKLCIAAGEKFEGLGHAVYNYSRSLDFDQTPPGLLEDVLVYLEAL